MSIDTRDDTITVNDITYHFDRSDHGDHTALTTEAFPGLEGRIGYDHFPEHNNPREWCNAGTMSVSYSRYNLGDEDISEIDFEITCPDCEGEGELDDAWRVRVADDIRELIPKEPLETFESEKAANEFADKLVVDRVASNDRIIIDQGCTRCNTEGSYVLNPVDYFKKEHGARVVLPLSVYEHSGITMFVGHEDYSFDPGGWDTSYVGFIYDTPEGVKQCIGENATNEDIDKALRQEVAIYASYLEGDVTEYHVEDDETNFSDGCGGYVGDSDYCEAECFRSMEAAIEKRLMEQQERAEMAARDIITN